MKCRSGQVQDARPSGRISRKGWSLLLLVPEAGRGQSVLLAVDSGALPSGVPSLGCAHLPDPHASLGSGHLVTIPQLSSATLLLLRQDRIFP